MGDPFLFGLFLLSGIKISCLYDPTPPNKNNHRPPTPPSKIDIDSCNEGRHFKRYIIYCPMFTVTGVVMARDIEAETKNPSVYVRYLPLRPL